MATSGLPELSDEQFEAVAQAAEEAARNLIFSKVKQKQLDRLDVSVEAEGSKPVNFIVEVDLALLPEVADIDEKTLADQAVKEAFKAIEAYLSKLK